VRIYIIEFEHAAEFGLEVERRVGDIQGLFFGREGNAVTPNDGLIDGSDSTAAYIAVIDSTLERTGGLLNTALNVETLSSS
jgi:hypothetical protein